MSHRQGAGAPGRRLENRGFGFYSPLRSEFCNYAVGPWVSVSGRETALARGNPVKRRNFDLRFSNFDCFAVSVFNRQSKIDIRKYKMPIRYGRFEMPKTLSKKKKT